MSPPRPPIASSLIDEPADGLNVPEFSVSEISAAVKRAVEQGFDRVRVRGEICNLSRPRSGHVYLGLKDDRAMLSGVIWRSGVRRLSAEPEEGMEVVATGRLTTYPGASRYQIIIDDIAPAGIGALMAMLEKRRKALAAEGLFDADRKKPLPHLPRVIGVVTSPSGAVIRDILHRIEERFPTHVLVWPSAMQGKECAPQVAAAIRNFSRIPASIAPRPDLLIVARGGGSVEDLWGFNEEDVVRAVAECPIPVISAIGHETDTTLIDYVADYRAPTPTAAAEAAVPVRRELVTQVAGLEARRLRALDMMLSRWRQRLTDLARALPRADAILADRRQALDLALARLPRPDRLIGDGRSKLALLSGRLRPALRQPIGEAHMELSRLAGRIRPALQRPLSDARMRLARAEGGLRPALQGPLAAARMQLSRMEGRFMPWRLHDRAERLAEQLAGPSARLGPALIRLQRERGNRLAALARTLRSLGPDGTLARGFAIIRDGEGKVLQRASGIAGGTALEIEFADDRINAVAGGPAEARTPAAERPPAKARPTAKAPKKPKRNDKQGSLF